MAIENFSTYTEVDPNSRIVVTSTRVTWTLLTRDEDAYVYKDKGANYFSGDFTIKATVRATGYEGGNTGRLSVCALTNLVDDYIGIRSAGGDELAVRLHTEPPHYIFLQEMVGGVAYTGDNGPNPAIAQNIDYYLTLVRDESVGTYGTLYCYVYSDAARTVLVNTLTYPLHAKKDFRYVFAAQSWNTNDASIKHSGYVENLEIYLFYATYSSSVTTQAVTAIDKTTATGNGNVISLGSPAATQYGHCWATFPNPTTANSKTEKGVPSATGAYTSSLTGLIPNTLYYVRAYITNSIGTFYGAEVQFYTLPDVPAVTTDLITEIAGKTALGNGSIDNNGGSAITQHGHCWSLSANPTIADSKTQNGVGGIGAFTSAITGLTANTLYHVRAYATNSLGTGYGADKTFTTQAIGAPTVTTQLMRNEVVTSATGHGTIVDIGASAVTQHGHCWSASPSYNPTTANSKTTLGAGAVGAFESEIKGLTAGQAYYCRAYATNSYGTGYGNNVFINQLADQLKGNLAVKDEEVVYTSKTGKRYYIQGVRY